MLGRKGKSLFMPMRVALTGRGSGPDLPAQLQVLALAPGAVASGTSVVGLDERMAVRADDGCGRFSALTAEECGRIPALANVCSKF